MLEMIVGAVIGVAFFMVPLWCYRKGIKDGIALKQDKPMEPIKTPIQVVKEEVYKAEAKQKNDKTMQGLINLLSYTGDPQKYEEE